MTHGRPKRGSMFWNCCFPLASATVLPWFDDRNRWRHVIHSRPVRAECPGRCSLHVVHVGALGQKAALIRASLASCVIWSCLDMLQPFTTASRHAQLRAPRNKQPSMEDQHRELHGQSMFQPWNSRQVSAQCSKTMRVESTISVARTRGQAQQRHANSITAVTTPPHPTPTPPDPPTQPPILEPEMGGLVLTLHLGSKTLAWP